MATRKKSAPTATVSPSVSKPEAEVSAITSQPKQKIKPASVQAGDMMAIIHYVKVDSRGWNKLVVSGLDEGVEQFEVIGNDLIENMLSANQFNVEETVTKTRAAEILVSSHNRPLTVCFEKADGEERVMRGRLIGAEPLLGRSHVEDLEKPKTEKHRMRLVDHRTIKYIIVDGYKYTVKGK